jgi:hypothetical protein
VKHYEVEVVERSTVIYRVAVHTNETIEELIELDDWAETATIVETKVSSIDVLGWKEAE